MYRGVVFGDAGTTGRLEGCDIFANEDTGVWIGKGAAPVVATCRCVGGGLKRPKPASMEARVLADVGAGFKEPR